MTWCYSGLEDYPDECFSSPNGSCLNCRAPVSLHTDDSGALFIPRVLVHMDDAQFNCTISTEADRRYCGSVMIELNIGGKPFYLYFLFFEVNSRVSIPECSKH